MTTPSPRARAGKARPTLEQVMRKIARENPGPPRQGWFYSKDLDTLHAFVENVEHYGDWICRGLTVYRAFDDKRIVGFFVDGVLMQKAGRGKPYLSPTRSSGRARGKKGRKRG